jgi:hypothetical protein
MLHWTLEFGDCVHVPGSIFYYFTRSRDLFDPSAYDTYHFLQTRPAGTLRLLPEIRWALQTAQEIAHIRSAFGRETPLLRLVPTLCFLHQGGARHWALQFAYWNAPAPLRRVWRSVKGVG